MSAARSSRLWVIAGTLLGLVLVAATWFLVVSPARSQVASVQGQVDDATVQQTVLRHRLTDLQTAAKDMGSLTTQLAAAGAALPTSVDTQGLLRRLQVVAHAEGARLDNVGFGQVTATSVEGVSATPVTVALTGTPGALVGVVSRLQDDEARLLTIDTSSLKKQDTTFQLSLTMKAYSTAAPAAADAGTATTGTTAGTGAGDAPAGGAATPGAPTAS